MARVRFEQAKGKPRGQGYFPQLAGLGRAITAVAERASTTDRGLTGAAVRDAESVRELLDKRAAKLARRAARAQKG